MKPPPFRYARPLHVDQAVELLADNTEARRCFACPKLFTGTIAHTPRTLVLMPRLPCASQSR